MKWRIAVIAVLFWIGSFGGGGLWGHSDQTSQPPGLRKVRQIEDLYGAGLYDDALKQCVDAVRSKEYDAYLPEFLYLQWVINEKCGRIAESERIHAMFIKRFDGNILGAEMAFAAASKFLWLCDYSSAEKELVMIQNRYPNAPVNNKVRILLNSLHRCNALENEKGEKATITKK